MSSARAEISLSLQFQDPRHRGILQRHRVARWVKAVLTGAVDVTVRVVDEDEARQMNRDYRGKDYPTNVLTFDYGDRPPVMVDLVLCAPVVEREATEWGVDLLAHYAHLVVHGCLHAQGHDHEQGEAEALAMEALETRILTALGVADPYAQRTDPSLEPSGPPETSKPSAKRA